MNGARVIRENYLSKFERDQHGQFFAAEVHERDDRTHMNGRIQYGDAQVHRPARVTSVARYYTHLKFHRFPSSRLWDLGTAFARARVTLVPLMTYGAVPLMVTGSGHIWKVRT